MNQTAGPSPELRALLDPAVAAHREGRLEEASALYRKVLEIAPQEPNALTNLGTVALQQGRLAEGVALIEASLKVKPDQSNAVNNRGNALLSLGRMAEALEAFDHALRLDPRNAEAHSNRGVALSDLGRAEEAVAAYRRAVELRPGFLDALNGLGIVLESMGRSAEALAVYDEALQAAPQSWELHYNRGNALRGLNRPDEAVAAYERGLSIQPNVPGARANLGVALQALGRFDEAMAQWDLAIAQDPECNDAHWNKALLKLMRGDWREGWKEYEWRWRQPSFINTVKPEGPLWLGEVPLKGRRLLIVNEQGFGDTLQMMRYAPVAAKAGAAVLMIVEPPLFELAQTVGGVEQVLTGGEPVTYDFWIPMMSLPLAFGTTPQTLPAEIPYIAADPSKVAVWSRRLGPKTRPRVGLVWSGRASHGNDVNRSIPLGLLTPLLEADAEFISLQTEYREADRAALAALPIRDVSAELQSFGDTAALLENLDLAITVDTSVAHLAGALGKAQIVLLPWVPDFRWGLGSDATPWYPKAKLVRQPARGDWASAIAEAKAQIAALRA